MLFFWGPFVQIPLFTPFNLKETCLNNTEKWKWVHIQKRFKSVYCYSVPCWGSLIPEMAACFQMSLLNPRLCLERERLESHLDIHIKKVSNTIKFNLQHFKQIRPFLTVNAAKSYLHCMILSHIEYCFTNWSFACATNLKPIEQL